MGVVPGSATGMFTKWMTLSGLFVLHILFSQSFCYRLEKPEALEVEDESTDSGKLKTIDNILKDNARMEDEVQRLNDIITYNITELSNSIDKVNSRADTHAEFCMWGWSQTITSNTTLEYDYLSESSGEGAMNTTDGTFTAAVSGHYTISLSGSARLYDGQMIYILPWRTDEHRMDGQYKSENGSGNSDYVYVQGTSTFIVYMWAGQQMWWKVDDYRGAPYLVYMTFCVTLNHHGY